MTFWERAEEVERSENLSGFGPLFTGKTNKTPEEKIRDEP